MTQCSGFHIERDKPSNVKSKRMKFERFAEYCVVLDAIADTGQNGEKALTKQTSRGSLHGKGSVKKYLSLAAV